MVKSIGQDCPAQRRSFPALVVTFPIATMELSGDVPAPGERYMVSWGQSIVEDQGPNTVIEADLGA